MDKQKTVLIVLIIVLIIFGGIFIFLIQDKTTEIEERPIRIGYLSIAPDLSFFVALDQGYFENYGLKVEPIKFESSNQAIDAIILNRVDGTSIVALEALLSVEEKSSGEFKIYEMTAAEEGTEVHKVIVRKDSSVESLSDLEGKIIGTYPGSQMRVFTNLVFGNHLDISSITISQMAPPLQVQALNSGQVDALFTLEPIGTIAESKGISKTIEINPLYKELLQPFPTAASAFSDEFVEENPETVKKYLLAIDEAHRFIESNENRAKRSLSTYTSIDEGLTDKVGIYSYWNVEEINVNAVNRLIDLYAENEILKGDVSAEDVILV